MNKRWLLFGFIFILLLAIPLTVFIVQQQTQTKQHAAASTSLVFTTTQQQINVGQTFSVDISITPGTNQVSFVKLNISYDGTKIATTGAGITPNPTLNLVTLDGPNYGQCSGNNCFITVTYSIGADPTKAITSQTVLASINFKALADTSDTGSTALSFNNGTQVLSLATSDQPSENVLSSSNGTQLTIVTPSGTPTDTPGAGTTGTPTDTTTPTQAGGGNGGNGGGNGGTGTTNTPPPVCSSLLTDNNASDSAPFTVLFTANGTSDNSTTISKVTFNFGDGAVQDVTSAGGIGTGTANVQISHTYQATGLFTATATLMDANGNISNPTTCTQTINVGNITITPTGATGGTQGTTTNPTATPIKTLPPTGPGQTILVVGGIGAAIAVVGGLLIFGL